MPAPHPLPNDTPKPPFEVEPSALALLNRLRFMAAACRVSARLDLHEACARLDTGKDRGEEAHIVTLIRVMGQALEARPVFRRPGEPDLSFDEAWLVSTIGARMAQDDASFTFLVTRRVAASKRRLFGTLISGLADHLTQTATLAPFTENLTPAPTRAGLSY